MLIAAARARCAGVPAVPLLLAASLAIAFVAATVRSLAPAPAPADAFASPDVTAAPRAALAANGSSAFSDARGAYHRLAFPGAGAGAGGDAQYVNVVFSRAGAYRSGDMHKCDQVNLMVAGEAVLTTLRRGRRVEQVMRAGDLVTTPAGVPHLFHFTADSTMSEYWVDREDGGKLCRFRAWYYKPFRDIIDKSLAGSAGGEQ